MTGQNVRILMRLTAQPNRENELKDLLLQCIEDALQHEGCLSCEMLQHRIDMTRFIVVEEWNAEARLQSSLENEILQKLLLTGAELLLEPPLIDWYNTVHSLD